MLLIKECSWWKACYFPVKADFRVLMIDHMTGSICIRNYEALRIMPETEVYQYGCLTTINISMVRFSVKPDIHTGASFSTN